MPVWYSQGGDQTEEVDDSEPEPSLDAGAMGALAALGVTDTDEVEVESRPTPLTLDAVEEDDVDVHGKLHVDTDAKSPPLALEAARDAAMTVPESPDILAAAMAAAASADPGLLGDQAGDGPALKAEISKLPSMTWVRGVRVRVRVLCVDREGWSHA